MADVDTMLNMSEERKAKHREQIAQRFASFRRYLDGLASNMYTDHFTDDLRKSPEYATMLDTVANWERAVLEKYGAKDQ